MILWKVLRYQNHPSIISIKENTPNKPPFLFKSLKNEFLRTLVDTLDSSKSCKKDDVPIKIIKMNSDIISEVLVKNINQGSDRNLNIFFPEFP